MTDDVLHAIGVLFTPGQVIEVRAITDEGMASGYFDDPDKLAERVNTLDGLSGMQGIYVTLNEVNPALLSRRANRIKTRLSKKDATTADTDILRRHWFPIGRPSTIPREQEPAERRPPPNAVRASPERSDTRAPANRRRPSPRRERSEQWAKAGGPLQFRIPSEKMICHDTAPMNDRAGRHHTPF